MAWWKRSEKRPRGMPDLRKFRKSSAYYYELHLEAMRENGDFGKRVTANWGLIARGSESIPYLQRMLASAEADSREDAAGAFEWLAKEDVGIVDDLLRALADETADQPRDSIVLALGSLKDPRAIPALATLVRDERTDGDTRWCAAESLGKIARRRFDLQPDPIAAAVAWLDERDARA